MLYGNRALQLLYACNGVFVVAGAMLAPIYALFAEAIGAKLFTVSLLATAFLVSRLACTFVVRYIGDDIAKKENLLLIGLLVRAISWFGLIVAGNITALFIIQVMLGLGEAFGTPSFNAIFAEHLNKGHHIAEYASWDIVSTTGAAVGTVAGGYIAATFGFIPLFAVMGSLALISFLGILLKPGNLRL